ncbi:MAG: 16S rRNA (adenine(1518)-N(6)/adenine(1519)-N(6)) -dimethyltransferase RsmA [Candidatus Improbicoccus pseudotrichonymphae]|uniref:Ribosomal RNA small subunit methyltransferase A n=1 Tax=Candidatus Improbicoccus pseudotrichonymphae TaxID=3033792 RepID=A0AA48KYN9_9FIRM|nr:MAG: 16S rRNA (adenine(1518)-N(6)/adenine(1519)-N(6)) -dimethyltransferase RsmA [Candidatus Improbicoccus pseudotrichonymphae]
MYNPYNIDSIKNILRVHGAKPLKQLGQNFLVDFETCEKISVCALDRSSSAKKNMVVEIGPGLGSLTLSLLKKFDRVCAIEFDKILFEILNKKLISCEKFNLVNQDALKFDFKNLIHSLSNYNLSVCSNLPYYVTSPILSLLFENSISNSNIINFNSIVVMVQKEVGERLLAQLGERACGFLTLLVQTYSKPKKLFDVSKDYFYPSPSVDSTVIFFEIRNDNFRKIRNKENFFKISKLLFSERRKTILNNLNKKIIFNKDKLSQILKNINVNPNLRAENLNFEDFLNIYNVCAERS